MYRKLVDYLDKNTVIFHTFQLKQDKAFSVVIKGLQHSTLITDIKSNLIMLRHQVRNVRNIISRFTKRPLLMLFVDTDPLTFNSEIYDLRAVMVISFLVKKMMPTYLHFERL